MKFAIPVLIILFVIFSCSKDETDLTKENEIEVKSLKVSDTILRNEPFLLEFKILVSGCETYSRLEVLPFETYTKFKVFVKDPSEDPCLTGIFEEDIKENIKIKTKGNHQLVFNDSTLIKNNIH